MFEEFMGVPAHPLLIHAPVVFVPLLAILTIAYGLVPFVRPHTRWVLGLLAFGTPIAALLAKLSGDAFFARMQNRNAVTPEFIPTIVNHRELGTLTVYATSVLGLLTLALVYFVGPRVAAARASGEASPGAGEASPGAGEASPGAGEASPGAGGASPGAGGASSPRVLSLVLTVLSLVAAAVSLYYVLRTGDSGAKAVWTGS